MAHPLAGVYAAAVTPLGKDLIPDQVAIISLLDFLSKRGCHGALLLGTTGEGPSFSFEERSLVIHAAGRYKAQNPEFRLLAGTGTPSLSETINLTKFAFDHGFDGVVTLPPYYYKKVDDKDLLDWFNQVIEKSVPQEGFLLAYHIPALTGVTFSLDLLTRLKDANPSRFAGIKDSSGDPGYADSLNNLVGDQFLLMTGNDRLLMQALQSRAGGCITALANIYSPLLRLEWDINQGDSEQQRIQEKINQLRSILDRYSPYAPTLKLLLKHKYGFANWPVRLPLHAPTDELATRILKDFSEAESAVDFSSIVSMIK